MVSLQGQQPDGIVRALATALIATSTTAVAGVITEGRALADALQRIGWTLVQALPGLDPALFGTRVDALLERLRDALRQDEHVTALRSVLESVDREGMQLLTEAARLASPSAPIAPAPAVPSPQAVGPDAIRQTRHVTGSEIEPVLEELRRDVASLGDATVDISWTVRKS